LKNALFCRDCKHMKAANPLIYWGMDRLRHARCYSPAQISGNGLIHPVLEQGSFCSINRRDPDRCGETAKWYESQ
jgi:hypothetical protein